MDEPKESPARRLVSPEYKSRCMEWALKVANIGETSGNIVKAAEAFYKYVYGDE